MTAWRTTDFFLFVSSPDLIFDDKVLRLTWLCSVCTPWRRWIQFDMKLCTNDRTLPNSAGLNVNCYFCFEINISDRLSASLNRIFIFIGTIFFYSSFTHNLSWLGPRVRQCVCVAVLAVRIIFYIYSYMYTHFVLPASCVLVCNGAHIKKKF